jgi:predicted dehydrogenase
MTPWGNPKSNPRSFPYRNSTHGGGKGGGAYRRWDSSGEASREVGEVTAVTLRYGSASEVVGVGWSTCAGGGVRQRQVLWPAHGEIVQLVGSGGLTKWRRGGTREELENGAETYPVHVRRWAEEVQQGWFGVSGEVLLGLRACEASWVSSEANRAAMVD